MKSVNSYDRPPSDCAAGRRSDPTNRMTIASLKNRAKEVFNSIIIFCPDFPPAAQTNPAKKFEQLAAIIDALLEKVRAADANQWLRACMREVQQARKHYDHGERKKGMELMQPAEAHFDNAFSRNQTAPRLVVGNSGSVSDTESDFPQ